MAKRGGSGEKKKKKKKSHFGTGSIICLVSASGHPKLSVGKFSAEGRIST